MILPMFLSLVTVDFARGEKVDVTMASWLVESWFQNSAIPNDTLLTITLQNTPIYQKGWQGSFAHNPPSDPFSRSHPAANFCCSWKFNWHLPLRVGGGVESPRQHCCIAASRGEKAQRNISIFVVSLSSNNNNTIRPFGTRCVRVFNTVRSTSKRKMCKDTWNMVSRQTFGLNSDPTCNVALLAV
eukprot:jgi/Bigna1/68180/fgenesh1_pg.5_\